MIPNERPPRMNCEGPILTLRTPKMPNPMVPMMTKKMMSSATRLFISASLAGPHRTERPASSERKIPDKLIRMEDPESGILADWRTAAPRINHDKELQL